MEKYDPKKIEEKWPAFAKAADGQAEEYE